MSNVMDMLMDEFSQTARGVTIANKYQLITFGNLSTGATQKATIPYTNWRVVAVGYNQTVAGASVAGTLKFGIVACDIGAADDDRYAAITENASYGEAGDMYCNDKSGVLPAFDSVTHAPTFGAGGGKLNVWESKPGTVVVSVGGGGNFDAVAFMLIEVA